MTKSSRNILEFVLAVVGVFAMLCGLIIFNRYLLMQFTLGVRMVLMIATQWLLFLIPAILMLIRREKLTGLGFSTEKVPQQILIGFVFSLVMSLLLTVLPILCGLKDIVGSTNYTKTWQFLYELIYTTVGVALAEEIIFRGYLFQKLMGLRNSWWFAAIFSSILFGLFHIFNGSLIQVFMTAVIGFIYCLARKKIKGCTLLSLIVAHGMYDAMIVLWVALL